MRRLITSDDIAKRTVTQNRLGIDTVITSEVQVTEVGLLNNYKLISTPQSDILYFKGLIIENDGGEGFYSKTSETHPDDVGIYITVAGVKYKRIFTGPVRLEWFSIDSASALLRASKYGHIQLTPLQVYVIYRQLHIILENNLVIDMNGAIISSYVKGQYLLKITNANQYSIDVIKGTFSCRFVRKVFKFVQTPKQLDCSTLMTYTPAHIATPSKAIATNKTKALSGVKSFTQPIEAEMPEEPYDLVTNEYLDESGVAANIVSIDKYAEIQGMIFEEQVIVNPTLSLDIPDNQLVTRDFLQPLAQYLFDTKIKDKLRSNYALPIPIGGCYLQIKRYMNGGVYNPPHILWVGTCWKKLNFETTPGTGASIALGNEPEPNKIIPTNWLEGEDTEGSTALAGTYWQRQEPFLSEMFINEVKLLDDENNDVQNKVYKFYRYKTGRFSINVKNFRIQVPASTYTLSTSIYAPGLDIRVSNYNHNIIEAYITNKYGLIPVVVYFTFSKDGLQQTVAKVFTVHALPGATADAHVDNLIKLVTMDTPVGISTRLHYYTNNTNTNQTFRLLCRYFTTMQDNITPRADIAYKPPEHSHCAWMVNRVVTTTLFYEINGVRIQVYIDTTKVKKRNYPSHTGSNWEVSQNMWSVSSRISNDCATSPVWLAIVDRVISTPITLKPGETIKVGYRAYAEFVGPYTSGSPIECQNIDLNSDTNLLGVCRMPDTKKPLYLVFE